MISHTFSQVIRGQKRSLKVVGTSFRSFSQISGNVLVSHTTTTSSHVSQKVYSPESSKVTEMVDDLLKYTRSLMDGSRHHIVAYSGGIDSSLVAMLIQKSAQSDESVRAVLGLSPAVPTEQISLAEEVATIIGIPLEKIETTESTDEMYIENNGKACYACKTHLYTCLEKIFEHSVKDGKGRLYNGTNRDDLKDSTRVGLIAADQFFVQSPLKNISKDEVRIVAKHLQLPNWNFAASPCLRSRLALGVQAIPLHLKRIEKAERHVRACLEIDPTRNLRVRLLTKARAMVEVEEKFLDHAKHELASWQVAFQEMGFSSVDVRSFKSGSVAT